MLHPRPAFADRVEDRLRSGAVRDIGGCQIDHQQPPVRIDRDMALSANDFLSGVVATRLAMRRFDRLAIDHRSRWACLAPLSLAVEHEFDVMDRLEQETARQFPAPTI